ncbi:MAG: amidohydrolase family protein, partial [Proteobacteria bacterium]|nr:amidohydrolase family protein [Pseudomonadota bacterium]
IGRSGTMPETLKQLIQHGIKIEQILPTMTSNVADLLKLPAKGRLRPGYDADLVVLGERFDVQHVMARGCWHVREYKAIVSGTYENT